MPDRHDIGECRILLVLAHPGFERSVAQRGLVERHASDRRIRIHDLYEIYPDFAINVRREQSLLLSHDVVLLHFPLFWYATPALLKEWIDVAWLAGVAHGDGAAFGGKRLACAVSTGQVASVYLPAAEGGVGTIEDLLLPLRRTASFCEMRWVPPFVVHGAVGDDDAMRYETWIEALAATRPGR